MEQQDTADSNELEVAFLGVIEGDVQQNPWTTKLQLGAREITFKLDTGTEVNTISEDAYRSLQTIHLRKSTKRLFGPGRTPLEVIGEFQQELKGGNKSTFQQIFVVKGLTSNLLGLPAITALGLIARVSALGLIASSPESTPQSVPRFGKIWGAISHPTVGRC